MTFMKNILRKVRDRMLAGVARQEDLDRLYDQVSGLVQIQNAMEGKPVLRPLRGWALSPDALVWILADLEERHAPEVIEFGSGQSTVILASYLKNREGRCLVSVEHDAAYLAGVQRQVAAWGLSEQVRFFHAPLKDTDDAIPSRSYDLAVLPDLAVDLAVVDGPPLANGNLTRLTPLRWAARHLKPGGAIFLDDSSREAEQACLQQLMIEHPSLRTTRRRAEKGLVELRID
jgi:predicted O-methyltransferase YrrM